MTLLNQRIAQMALNEMHDAATKLHIIATESEDIKLDEANRLFRDMAIILEELDFMFDQRKPAKQVEKQAQCCYTNHMLAKQAVNGKMYKLEQRSSRPSYIAECNGLNYLGDFMLFLVFTEWGERKMLAIPLTEVIQPV